MVTIRPSRGLHLGPGEAGPSHAAEALNVFWLNGELRGRNGGTALDLVTPATTATWVGQSVYPAEPTLIEDVSTNPVGSVVGGNCITAGDSGTFNSLYLQVTATVIDVVTELADAWAWEYWNGTAWVALSAALAWKGTCDTANDDYEVVPLVVYDDSGGVSANGGTLQISFEPPQDWASKTINGKNYYWVRGYLDPNGGWSTVGNISEFAGGGVISAERQCVFVDTWKDRGGTPHRLSVFNQSGTLTFVVDGVSWTSEVFGALAADVNTDIVGAYVPMRNQYFGRLKGVGWFKLNHIRRTVEAHGAGTDEAYEFLDRGLRTVIPNNGPAILFDGRWLFAEGAQLVWSAPGVFTDVLPNEFEDSLQDGYGDVVCMVAAKEWAAVFTNNAAYRVASDGTSDGYTWELVTGNVGCVGPRAACLVGDVVMFLAADGVYQLDASGGLTKMSGAINEFFRNASITAVDRAQMVYDSTHDQVRLFLCSNNEGHVFDVALYADANGYVEQVAGESKQEMAWWPQGREDPTQYGFQGTYVHVDNTRPVPVMLLGDRYGTVWTCDQVGYEGGPITRKFMSSAVNVDTSQQVILRWLNVAMRNLGNAALTLRVRPDGIEAYEHTVSSPVYVDATSTQILNATSLADDTTTVQDAEATVLMENTFEVRARTFQVGFTQEQAWHDLALLSFEVQVNRGGKRGAR